jgi:hypothetical protein
MNISLVSLLLVATQALAAVTVSSFTAKNQANQIIVAWMTASEVNTMGFNLLRSTSATGTYNKINSILILSKCLGCVTGASYSYTDSAVTTGKTYYYKLQSVDHTGTTQLFGPASASVGSPPTPPTKTGTPSSTLTNPSASSTRTPPWFRLGALVIGGLRLYIFLRVGYC